MRSTFPLFRFRQRTSAIESPERYLRVGFKDTVCKRVVATQQSVDLPDLLENAKCLNRYASWRIRGSLRDCACASMRCIARFFISERSDFGIHSLTRGYREHR